MANAGNENNKIIGSLLAGAAVTEWRFLTVSGGENVQHSSAGARVDGVSSLAIPTVGMPVPMWVDGIVLLTAGAGGVTDGAGLISGAAGVAVVTTTGFAAAVALEAAAEGEAFRALLIPKVMGSAAPEVITNTPGAISLGTKVTFISPDGTDAMTLADGSYNGQEKIIRMIAGANTPVASITGDFDEDGTARTTLTLNATGEGAHLVWHTGVGWRLVMSFGTSPTFS